ncbi:UNKNOWN [Stylonychia lemnae]|uniref:Uncharacterized protein n=1 Tax=Stylonychia lemnae TaxID=5949 RepID=A0A078ANI3_STYLE|nr:UNKNOWN [Stylonychia lemnae]|eukprot:CDW82528.1 UNKNOWN [Stylonychia lemnae]
MLEYVGTAYQLYHFVRVDTFPTLEDIVIKQLVTTMDQINNTMIMRGMYFASVPGYFWIELHINKDIARYHNHDRDLLLSFSSRLDQRKTLLLQKPLMTTNSDKQMPVNFFILEEKSEQSDESIQKQKKKALAVQSYKIPNHKLTKILPFNPINQLEKNKRKTLNPYITTKDTLQSNQSINGNQKDSSKIQKDPSDVYLVNFPEKLDMSDDIAVLDIEQTSLKANKSVNPNIIDKNSMISNKMKGSILSKTKKGKLDSTFRQLVDDDMTDKGDISQNNMLQTGCAFETQRNLLEDEQDQDQLPDLMMKNGEDDIDLLNKDIRRSEAYSRINRKGAAPITQGHPLRAETLVQRQTFISRAEFMAHIQIPKSDETRLIIPSNSMVNMNEYPTFELMVKKELDEHFYKINQTYVQKGLWWRAVPGHYWIELRIDQSLKDNYLRFKTSIKDPRNNKHILGSESSRRRTQFVYFQNIEESIPKVDFEQSQQKRRTEIKQNDINKLNSISSQSISVANSQPDETKNQTNLEDTYSNLIQSLKQINNNNQQQLQLKQKDKLSVGNGGEEGKQLQLNGKDQDDFEVKDQKQMIQLRKSLRNQQQKMKENAPDKINQNDSYENEETVSNGQQSIKLQMRIPYTSSLGAKSQSQSVIDKQQQNVQINIQEYAKSPNLQILKGKRSSMHDSENFQVERIDIDSQQHYNFKGNNKSSSILPFTIDELATHQIPIKGKGSSSSKRNPQ